MVKIRKPKKDNKEILPIENTEAINETLNKSEEFINKNKNKMEELSTYNARIEGLFTTKAYKFLIGKNPLAPILNPLDNKERVIALALSIGS